MGNITIKMLARELNLSTAAISKALRDSHDISTITKERVQALAAKLNYVPNPYAGSLRRRKSKTIGVVIPEVANSFFSLALNGIEEVAIEKGYHALIYLTHEKLAREKAILKDLQSGRVDGVIMSITLETDSAEHIRELNARQVPLVFFDRVCEDIETAKIITDDFHSAYEATRHLIDCGCKNIALLSISKSLSISSKRMEGYQQALADHRIKENPANLIFCSDDPTRNFALIKKVMQRKQRPDGIVATVENLTTEIYQVNESLGIRIPQDLKVVCFSNLSTAAILNPSLTTITQPAYEMGKTAATILFKALEKKNFTLVNENLVIPSFLVIRNSTVKKRKK
jgi:LacI family transcriptional regulator